MVLRKAFSVVIGIGFSRFFATMAATTPATITIAIPRMIQSFLRERFCGGRDANTDSVLLLSTPNCVTEEPEEGCTKVNKRDRSRIACLGAAAAPPPNGGEAPPCSGRSSVAVRERHPQPFPGDRQMRPHGSLGE